MKGHKTLAEWISTFGFREWILAVGVLNIILSFVLTYIVVLFGVSAVGIAIMHGVLGLILLAIRGIVAIESH